MVQHEYITASGNTEQTYIDENLQKNANVIINSVMNKGWDYLAIVCGIVGVGKSTFAQNYCKYLDKSFSIDRICFTAEEFVEKTSHGEKGQAFMLDESFADLNTKVTNSTAFIKIINHLQLIRQKGLYLVVILPDFFSLSKNVAIFRASHLFVVYHDNFNRGRFAAFDREKKKTLYIKGAKYINYQAEKPNFRGRFTSKWTVDFAEYERRKTSHLIAQSEAEEKKPSMKVKVAFSNICFHLVANKLMTVEKLADVTKLDKRTIYYYLEQNGTNK